LIGYEHAAPPSHLPRTSFNWEIDPSEFRDVLLELHETYRCPPIYITENGAYFDDQLSADGKVHDPNRVAFLEGYIKAVLEARERGVDIRGYFVWSLMDNFEWASGYRPTFGLVKTDFNTQKRIPKDSFFWYRDHIQKKV
jgi:beta-glucosidase